MMDSRSAMWKVFSWISFIISGAMIYLGFDKMLNYDSGEYYPYKYHNAYVGGDAYNYIINGNYSTAFFVLAAMFALLGIGFIIVYFLSKIDETTRTLLNPMIMAENEAKQAEAARQLETQKKVEAERKEREQALIREKEMRFNNYWETHLEEKEALVEKKAQAKQKLNEIGVLATTERKVLQELIASIDEELTKER